MKVHQKISQAKKVRWKHFKRRKFVKISTPISMRIALLFDVSWLPVSFQEG